MSAAADLVTLRPVPRYRGGAGRFFRRDRIRMLREWGAAAEPERIASFQFLRRNIILVNDPELVSELFLTRDADFHKGPALSVYSRPLLGDGLLTSEEDAHRRQRRLAAPAFAHKRVAAYADAMVGLTDAAQAVWSDGATIDVAREMMRLTLGIVGKTLFDADHTGDEADTVGRSLTTVLEYLTSVLRSPVRLPFSYIPPWRGDVRRALADLDALIYGLIRDRRASGRDTGDLLSMLMLATDTEGESMSERQIRDESMTIFLAGHETTANALAWAWYLLTANPNVYGRVLSEVDTALQGRLPTYEDLPQLPYTLQVFKETLRLYPPAYMIARQAQCDTRLGDFRIPTRAIILVSPFLLHRNADVFPDPERFDPDRWTGPDTEKKLPRHAYIPFGGGPRVCIGASFALMEGHLILATIAQRVRFIAVSDKPVETEPLITLRPRGTIEMRVSRRSERPSRPSDQAA